MGITLAIVRRSSRIRGNQKPAEKMITWHMTRSDVSQSKNVLQGTIMMIAVVVESLLWSRCWNSGRSVGSGGY